ncbi:hypothetical protein [Kaistella sp.]|uniref:hypothetical protein n=1 Tax=Kaistella sp. TaxID=2782235 RepID=UPI0035A0436B
MELEKSNVISKSTANRLGKDIRNLIENNQDPSEEQINLLQNYRTSFKDDLSVVVSIVSDIAQIGGTDSITAFRVKRIESILSKIKREPTMQLGNMGDIAGCRIILYRDDNINTVISQLQLRFNVLSINDYIKNPKEDGYNGYHVYIESPINPKRKLEIQVRTKETHIWSSLVEIIDHVYSLKLKEGEKHEDLQEFLFYLSRKKKLDITQKQKIINIDKKHEIYSNLFGVFLKNYSRIRLEWLNVTSFEDKRYFIFEVKTDNTSAIYSFQNYEDAEESYFELFKKEDKSNFVLAHIEKPKFKRMCLAYASYVMIHHDYLNDWNDIILDLLKLKQINSNENNNNLLEYFKRNLHDQVKLIEQEMEEVNKYEQNADVNLDSLKEWKEEINEKLNLLPRNTVNGNINKGNKSMSFFDRIMKKINRSR